jgi:23S rRNA-/tRNA-specific pseudouridylate synthase
MDLPQEQNPSLHGDLTIRYRDDHPIAIDKPAGQLIPPR